MLIFDVSNFRCRMFFLPTIRNTWLLLDLISGLVLSEEFVVLLMACNNYKMGFELERIAIVDIPSRIKSGGWLMRWIIDNLLKMA